jgi:hypothetical protein
MTLTPALPQWPAVPKPLVEPWVTAKPMEQPNPLSMP